MVKQYPDKIIVKELSQGSFNSSGDPVNQTDPALFEQMGRAEINDGLVSSTGGEKVAFEWLFFMPKDAREFQIGAQVEIFKAGMSVVSSTVKQFVRDQFNCRLWV